MPDSYEFLKSQKDAIIERQRSAIEKRALNAERALRIIAEWPFDIQGDCVADARELARKALADNEGWSKL